MQPKYRLLLADCPRVVCLTTSTFPRLDNKLHIPCSFLIKTTVFACKGQIGASKSEERCCRFITCEGRVNCGARFRLLRRFAQKKFGYRSEGRDGMQSASLKRQRARSAHSTNGAMADLK